MASTASSAVADGFAAVKIYPMGGPKKAGDAVWAERKSFWKTTRERVAAVRDAIGHDVELLVDLAWNTRPADRSLIADLASDFDLYWIEEPYQNPSVSDWLELRLLLGSRLAGGEQLLGIRPFFDIAARHGLDVMMPDVKWVGGIGAARKVCSIAEASGVEVSLHNMSGPVATAASVQVAAVSPAVTYLEYCWPQTAWRNALVGNGETIRDGALEISDRPGLGIDWDSSIENGPRIRTTG